MVGIGHLHFIKESTEEENKLLGVFLEDWSCLFLFLYLFLFCWEFGVKHEFSVGNNNFEIFAHVEMPR